MVAPFRTFKRQRQALARLRDDVTAEVMYGGGARGGKSWMGCGWVLSEALDKPGSAWLIAREELTKLRDTTLLTFFKVAKELQATGEYTFNATSLTATFGNGSVIFFREIKYIPSDPFFDRLGSYDLTGAFIDEAQQIHPQAVNTLRGRFSVLSGTRPDGSAWRAMPKMLFTCNPAKNWIYTDFYKPHRDGVLPLHKAFIASLATDNPFVSVDYIENLRRSDRVTVARLLEGNFEYDDDPTAMVEADAIAGLFRNSHVQDDDREYLTVDVARFGNDTTRIWRWRGWRAVGLTTLRKKSVPEVADAVRGLMLKHRIPATRVAVDDDGIGGGVRDLIPGSVGFINGARPMVEPETLASVKRSAQDDEDPPAYENLKTQCKYRMAARINAFGVWVAADLSPDDVQGLTEELGVWKRRDVAKERKIRCQPKEEEKKALGRSPDLGDAFMMREIFELQQKKSGLRSRGTR